MNVTIVDIAKKLKMHTSTVGYALSGKGTIKESTRETVVQTAKKMGYVPSRSAKYLRTKRSQTIGIILPQIVMGYNETAQFALKRALERGYTLQIGVTEFDSDTEHQVINSMLESHVDGIIIKPTDSFWKETPENFGLKWAVKQDIPIVLYGDGFPRTDLSCLKSVEGKSCDLIIEHLLAKGKEKICFATTGRFSESFILQTRKSFIKAGLDPEKNLYIVRSDMADDFKSRDPDKSRNEYLESLYDLLTEGGLRTGKSLFEKIIRIPDRPEAIVFSTESPAVISIIEAQNQGIQVPADLAIACMNRSLVANLSSLSLTTVSTLPHLIGETLVDFLIDQIEGKVKKGTVINVEPVLIAGEST